MTFKTVHGLGRAEYALKAVEKAMESGMNPSFVEVWVKWFDGAEGDALNQCDHCEHGMGVVCPDDCPQPEFYVGDLEEVAQAMVKRVEDAINEYSRQVYPDSAVAMPSWAVALFDGIRAEIATPGYVEALLPQ